MKSTIYNTSIIINKNSQKKYTEELNDISEDKIGRHFIGKQCIHKKDSNNFNLGLYSFKFVESSLTFKS